VIVIGFALIMIASLFNIPILWVLGAILLMMGVIQWLFGGPSPLARRSRAPGHGVCGECSGRGTVIVGSTEDTGDTLSIISKSKGLGPFPGFITAECSMCRGTGRLASAGS
jgi:hypothetical protein